MPPDRTSQINALLALCHTLVLILDDEREEPECGAGLFEELGDVVERLDAVTDQLFTRRQRECSRE